MWAVRWYSEAAPGTAGTEVAVVLKIGGAA
nr:hypothetical protein [Klebsiella pneumoniae]